MYREFGPLLFARKDGSPAIWGSLTFAGAADTPRPFIVLADSTDAGVLASYALRHWEVASPQVIVSVSGGAQDLKLDQRLERIFAGGLVAASVDRLTSNQSITRLRSPRRAGSGSSVLK